MLGLSLVATYVWCLNCPMSQAFMFTLRIYTRTGGSRFIQMCWIWYWGLSELFSKSHSYLSYVNLFAQVERSLLGIRVYFFELSGTSCCRFFWWEAKVWALKLLSKALLYRSVLKDFCQLRLIKWCFGGSCGWTGNSWSSFPKMHLDRFRIGSQTKYLLFSRLAIKLISHEGWLKVVSPTSGTVLEFAKGIGGQVEVIWTKRRESSFL